MVSIYIRTNKIIVIGLGLNLKLLFLSYIRSILRLSRPFCVFHSLWWDFSTINRSMVFESPWLLSKKNIMLVFVKFSLELRSFNIYFTIRELLSPQKIESLIHFWVPEFIFNFFLVSLQFSFNSFVHKLWPLGNSTATFLVGASRNIFEAFVNPTRLIRHVSGSLVLNDKVVILSQPLFVDFLLILSLHFFVVFSVQLVILYLIVIYFLSFLGLTEVFILFYTGRCYGILRGFLFTHLALRSFRVCNSGLFIKTFHRGVRDHSLRSVLYIFMVVFIRCIPLVSAAGSLGHSYY